MSHENEKFFTVVGCMDGRVVVPSMQIGQEEFDAEFPDQIDWPGIVGTLANNPTPDFLESVRRRLVDVSIKGHKSKGVVVNAHQECLGNPVDDAQQIKEVELTVGVIKNLVEDKLPVVGIFVSRAAEGGWKAEKV